MADSHGQELCARSETKSTELGRISYREFLLPGSSTAPPEIAEPEAEDAESTWQKEPTQQGRWQRLRSVQLCPIPAVPAWTLSTTGSTDGAAIAPTIDPTTVDAVTGAYGSHDAHAHAGPTNGKQCSDASANAHACTDVAAQCTGTGTKRAHCLPPEALCRPPPRHPAGRCTTPCRKEGKRVIKDLETAAKALGEARTVYEEALLARSQHINTWKVFLAEAVKNWSDYGKLFEQHEEALQARIAMAKEQFQDAKDCMEASNISVGKVVVQELSDEEDLPGDAGASAMQITESIQSLSTSLQQLSKATEAIQIEEQAAKRPRLDASKGEAEAASHFS